MSAVIIVILVALLVVFVGGAIGWMAAGFPIYGVASLTLFPFLAMSFPFLWLLLFLSGLLGLYGLENLKGDY